MSSPERSYRIDTGDMQRTGAGSLALKAVVAGAATLTALEVIGQRVLWKDRDTIVGYCDETITDETQTPHIISTHSPLDVPSSEVAGEILGDMTNLPITYTTIPNRGPSLGGIARASRENVLKHGVRRVNSLNLSLGGIKGLYESARWPDGEDDDVMYESYTAIDCPLGLDHVRGKRLFNKLSALALFAAALELTKHPGGPVTTFGFGSAMHKPPAGTNRLTALASCMQAGWDRAVGPGRKSSEPWTGGIRWLDRAEKDRPRLAEAFQRRLTPNTEITYIRSENDKTVDGERAADTLEEMAGREIRREVIPGAEHAAIFEHLHIHREIIGGILERASQRHDAELAKVS